MSKSYFEIGGEIVELDIAHPHLSSSHGDPSGVSQIAKQQSKTAVRNGRKAASPRAVLPYSYGNPFVWLGASVLIRGAQVILESQPVLAD